MRTRSFLLLIFLVACGHHSGNGDGGMCDPMDPSCGTPTHPVIVGCPGCPTFPPPGGGSPPACSGQGVAPQLVYPPDQVLLPPNMNVIEVQFLPGSGNALFEIDFANAGTDVRFETRCTAIASTRGQ